MKKNNPLAVQVGGSHYKNVKIQPVEFSEFLQLGFCAGNIVKYLCRWRQKNGLQDIDKAHHYLQLLIQLMGSRNWFPRVRTVAPHMTRDWEAIYVRKFLDQWEGMSLIEMKIIQLVVGLNEAVRVNKRATVRGLKKALELFPAIRELYLREPSHEK